VFYVQRRIARWYHRPRRGGGSVWTASGPGGSSAKHSFQAPRLQPRQVRLAARAM